MKKIETNISYSGISLDEVKTQVRVTHDFDDSFLSGLCNTSYHVVEDYINAHVAMTDVEEVATSFCGQYYEVVEANILSGFTITVSGTPVEYQVLEQDKYSTCLKLSSSLSDVTLNVAYTAGFASLPLPIKQAILVKTHDLYEDRSGYNTGLQRTGLFEKLLNKTVSKYS
ncbi:head-tail connector protein [uncultured Imperialibacter sp.]|uniref:head-tail connector protein n=1 Tax=uncultured Imperialibacter sp. TaxID=1672639 RepID=UPI0030DC05A5|tara:strand:- start:8764 stop:9273 length:510 start_codon:yes stop_codon:yes gene_type:complete